MNKEVRPLKGEVQRGGGERGMAWPHFLLPLLPALGMTCLLPVSAAMPSLPGPLPALPDGLFPT